MYKNRVKTIVALLVIVGLSISIISVTTPIKEKTTEKNVYKFHVMDKNRNKIFDTLDNILKYSTPSEKIPVIITFKHDNVNLDKLFDLLGQFKIKHRYKVIPGIAAKLYPWQIKLLSKLDFVLKIEYDAKVKATMDTARYWFSIDKIANDFGLEGDRDGQITSYSTTDIVVAVIDTGIDASHIDLDGGKVIAWVDYVNGRTSPYDDNGHGTHVAGIIAGTGEGNAAYKGVAPGVALIGLKVLDSQGSGSFSDVQAAIEWCINNKDKYNIRVINLSLGSSSSSDGTDSVSQAANAAVDAGIVVVVAAGNSGPAKYTIGSPGAADKVITVGAGADVGEGGFFLASFSSRGPTADGRIKPDIVSPGYKITAPDANSGSGYVTYSGTSMATPFTAGVVALMLDANPSLTPVDVKNILAQTAIDWGPQGKDIDYGYGFIDPYEAVKAAGGYTGTDIAKPSHDFKSGYLSGRGDADYYDISVTTTDYPIALTLIMVDWASSTDPDFDLYLISPSGSTVGSSEGTNRQETITYTPTTTGTYTIKVYSYTGSGDYILDISAGLGQADTTPPTISNVQVIDITETSATITWTTDEPADSTVEYGTTTSYGSTEYDPTLVTSHSITLTGLSPGTTYHFRVKSTDAAGNTAVSGDYTFTTLESTTPTYQHTVTFTGTVSSSSPDAWFYVDVHSVGFIYIELSWSTSADLDFYVYDPNGNYIGRAYTLNNPETLRVFTDSYGVGTYSIRVNLYSGSTTDFTLKVEGYEKVAYTGTVSPSSPDAYFDTYMAYTGTIYIKLTWSTSADLDFYVYDPNWNYVDRAYTVNNPETLWVTIDQVGTWHIRVNLYSGSTTDFTLYVYEPADNLS